MSTPADAKTKAAATYNAAADHFDDPANSFWERFGRATVDRLALRPGMRVLDVCCGSGASALPAAEAVGPRGFVLGVDLAEKLLERARAKAREQSLASVEFRVGDVLDLGLAPGSFDAVVCVFGIFFVPDMAAAVRALWQQVRPGGKLAITTWGPRFLEPSTGHFWRAVRDLRPELDKGYNPWDRIQDPASLGALLREGGIDAAEIVAVAGSHPIPTFDAWWAAVLGSGLRGTLDQFDEHDRERVRAANRAAFEREGIRSAEVNVVHAIATKPAGAR